MAGVLLVANWKSDVGYAWWLMENFWVQLSVMAEGRGIKSELIYPEIRTIPETIEKSPIEIHTLNYGQNTLAGFLGLARFILKYRIAYIYLTDKPFFSLKYLMLRTLGVRRIIVHDHSPGERTTSSGVKHLIKCVMNALPWVTADAIIAVTPYVKNRHVNLLCVPARKSRLVTNGISPIGRDPALRYYCHDLFGLPHDAIVVLTTARASRYKQIDFVIRCADVLLNRDRIERVYFVYCGDGPDMTRLHDLAQSLHLEDHFLFAGNRTDVTKIAQSCDIGFHPSKGEVGYSLSILEYMSAGLATVLSDNPSVCGATRDGQTGVLYRENVLESACDALRRLIADDDLRRRLGTAAGAAVASDYPIEKTNREFTEVVSSVFFQR